MEGKPSEYGIWDPRGGIADENHTCRRVIHKVINHALFDAFHWG